MSSAEPLRQCPKIQEILTDIAHCTTRVRHPQTNGLIERFHRTVLDEFFRLAFLTQFYETVEMLQRNLDPWRIDITRNVRIKATETQNDGPLEVIRIPCSQKLN